MSYGASELYCYVWFAQGMNFMVKSCLVVDFTPMVEIDHNYILPMIKYDVLNKMCPFKQIDDICDNKDVQVSNADVKEVVVLGYTWSWWFWDTHGHGK